MEKMYGLVRMQVHICFCNNVFCRHPSRIDGYRPGLMVNLPLTVQQANPVGFVGPENTQFSPLSISVFRVQLTSPSPPTRLPVIANERAYSRNEKIPVITNQNTISSDVTENVHIL